MVTGIAAVTEQEELALPLIGAKELYNEANHLSQTGHCVYESINTRNFGGHPATARELDSGAKLGLLRTKRAVTTKA